MLGLAGLGLAALLIASAAPAFAQVSKEAAAKAVADAFGVEVLRVRQGRVDVTQVWMVTVMNPGGTFNDAFQVTTLAVDQATGELVPAFRHGPNGPREPAATERGTRLPIRPDAARSGTWR